MEQFGLLRRHFFLFAALIVLVIMVVAGALKITSNKAGGIGVQAAAGRGQGGGARPGGTAQRGGRGGFGGPSLVSSVVIQPRTFVDQIEVLGVAKGRQSVVLTAATTQLVEKVNFKDGQKVARGAVLVELKDSEQEAGLAQAQAKLAQAKQEYDRWTTLGQKGFAAQTSIDQYKTAWLSAQADVNVAKARQSDRMIRAPFGGVVGLSDVTPGALVNPGAPIVTLDDLSTVRVDFQVPERYLSQLREGQALTAKVDAYPGETIHGRIAKLDTRIDERTRAITARAEFANPSEKLKPGMMVRVGVSRGTRAGVAAPESAVSVQGDTSFVYVIRGVGQRMIAEQRAVVTGIRQEGFVEITDGLKVGEQIVADGLNKLQPGQQVRPLPVEPNARGSAAVGSGAERIQHPGAQAPRQPGAGAQPAA